MITFRSFPQARVVRRRLEIVGPLVLAAMLLGSLMLWNDVRHREREQRQQESDTAAKTLAGRVESRLHERLSALDRMAKRWEAAGGTPPRLWAEDARALVGDMPGLISTQWLDATGQVRWAEPLAGNERLIGTYPNREPVRAAALVHAREERRITLSPPVTLIQGGAGVLVFRPLHVGERFDGFLVAVIRLENLVQPLLAYQSATRAIALRYAGRTVYVTDGNRPSLSGPVRSEVPLAGLEGKWTLLLMSGDVPSWTSSLSFIVLASGVAGSGLFAAVLWFWRLALVRAGQSSQLADIVARTTNAVILTDAHGRVEWVNEGFTRMSGYSLDEVKGRKPGELLQGPGTDPEKVAEMRAHLARGEGFRLEVLNYHKNGRSYWLDIEVQPIRSAGGEVAGFMAIESDITARKEAERALAEQVHFLERLLEVIPSPIYFKDTEGRYLGFNRAFETFFGVARADMLGKTVLELYAGDQETARFHWEKDLALLRDRGTQTFEATVPTPAGQRHTVYNKAVFYREGGVVGGLIGLISDVTERRQAEDILRLNEAKFRSLYELAPVGIALNRMADGQFIDGNRALFAMTGYTAEEFARLSYWDITPREYEAEEARQLELLRARGHYGPYEKEYIHKSGRRFPVQLQGVRLVDAQGQEVIWSVVEDITERKRAEQALRETRSFLETIIDSLPIMLFVKDAQDLRFVAFNRAGEELLGLGREQLLGRNDYDFFPKEQADFFVARDREVLGEGRRLEIPEEPIETAQGTRLLHTIKVPIKDAEGRPAYLLGISTDVTERKKMERMQNEFISTVSHELRTPVTVIRGALGLVAGGVTGTLPERAQELLDAAYKNSERLTVLINDILDIEKIGSGTMKFAIERHALGPLLEQSIQINAIYAQTLGVSFNLAPIPRDISVQVDGGRFLQVMTNLLSNAAKFSAAGGHVDLSLALHGRKAQIAVRDYGAGIPQEFQGRVFQKFSQADSSATRTKGGTGLGLAISKAIAEGMGGALTFETQPNVGTTFFFEVPLA
jgi:PAS domain S-box-containing protein